MFSFSAMKVTTEGSRVPLRVLIMNPSRGVRPMLVSITLPSLMAVMEEPLPRWQVMSLSPSRLFAGQLAVTGRNIAVGGSVETVAANLVFFIIFIGNGEHISLGRHGQVEAVIKHDNLRNIGAENLTAGTDTHEVGGVVKGSKVDKAFDAFHNLLVNKHRLVEQGAALNHAVADGRYFAHIL